MFKSPYSLFGVLILLLSFHEAVAQAASLQDCKTAYETVRVSYDSKRGGYRNSEYRKAIDLCLSVATMGNVNAQAMLGYLYAENNHSESIKWYREAAEQGHIEAQNALGVFYKVGRLGVPKNYAESVKWYRKAAEQGSVSSQVSLCSAYLDGQGVPKEYITAYAWCNVAAASGETIFSTLAAKLRDIAEHKLTATGLEEAQKLSREFFKKYTKE